MKHAPRHWAPIATLAVLGSMAPDLALAEQGWIVEEVRPEGADVELPGGIRIDVEPLAGHRARSSKVKVRAHRGLRPGKIHPGFIPVGMAIDVGDGTEAQAEVSLPAAALEPREDHRFVVAVELVRDHRLPPFDPRVAAPKARRGRETAAWVFANASATGDGARMAAKVALVAGRRLQAGWLSNDVRPPWQGATLGVGRRDVAVCVPRRGALLELDGGLLRALIRPSRSERTRRTRCDPVTLRQTRPLRAKSVHPSFVSGSSTVVLAGLGQIGLGDERRVELRSQLSGRPPADRRLVLAVEQIANTSDCPLSRGRRCEPRWEAQGFLFIAAQANGRGDRARARLPVPAQLGLRDGRLVFGWVRGGEGGVEIAAPRRSASRPAR